MISHLRGTITESAESHLVIDVGGVGFKVTAPSSVLASNLPGTANAVIHTAMIVTDSEIALYGFDTPAQREIFDLLLTVSGIGPKAAVKMLSIPKDRLLEAIAVEDAALLTTIQGIGQKTAKRVILELKDKIGKIFTAGGLPGGLHAAVSAPAGSEAAAAAQGLQALGYSPAEIRSMMKSLSESDLASPASEIIRLCLRKREK